MQEPSQPNSQPKDEENLEFEQAIVEVERSLALLKERYEQIQQDTHRQNELLSRLDEIQLDLRRTRNQELKTELQQIKQQLETIELNLESRLFSWRNLKEPFWMAVRFGGIGIILGWILKSYAG